MWVMKDNENHMKRHRINCKKYEQVASVQNVSYTYITLNIQKGEQGWTNVYMVE